jgi:hypothetical protein
MGMADDIRDLLVTGSFAATVHIGDLFELPNSAAVVTPTGGLPDLRTFSGAVCEQMTVQVRCRASDYPAADTLMQSAHTKLNGIRDKALGGRTYHWIVGVQSPFYLGLDDISRPVFACNYDILRST